MLGSKRFLVVHGSDVEQDSSQEKFENNQNGQDFFHMFPEEIWVLILSKVDTDVKKVILNSNLENLRRLLLPYRQNFHFPSGWEIICDKYKRPGSYLNKETQTSKGCLALRKVCRDWRRGVDKACLQRILAYYMELDKNDYLDITYGFWSNMKFCDSEKVTRCLEHFNSTDSGSNPFAIGGHLHLAAPYDEGDDCYDNDPDDDGEAQYESRQYNNAVKILLSKYGQHVTLCKISVADKYTSRLEYFKSIYKWLKLMPNLIGLDWQYSGGVVFSQDLARCMRFPEENPIPTWNQLQIAKFVSVPVEIVDHILTRNNRVQVLTSTPKIFSSEKVDVSGLQRLCIGMSSSNDLLALEKCEQTWQLQMIFLDFKYSASISWKRVFFVLQKWVETLIEVTIRIKLFARGRDTCTITQWKSWKGSLKAFQIIS